MILDVETGFPAAKVKRAGNNKHYKPVMFDRIGRLNRAETKYRKGKFHTGKGKTLRSHRSGQ